jgi:DNA-binding CsgD family transcriptional regulator
MMSEVLATYYQHEARRLLGENAKGKSTLTRRQLDCLSWVRHGKSSTDIGDLLGISRQTVEEHIAEACRKLGVRTRLQAAVEASLQGLLD